MKFMQFVMKNFFSIFSYLVNLATFNIDQLKPCAPIITLKSSSTNFGQILIFIREGGKLIVEVKMIMYTKGRGVGARKNL